MAIIIIAFILGGMSFLLLSLYEQHRKTHESEAEPNTSDYEQGLTRYDHYAMKKREIIMYSIAGIGMMFFIGYVFYQNGTLSVLLSLTGLYYPRIKKKQIIRKRQQELTQQFRQALLSLSSSLTAGKSLENAFRAVIDDLKMIYPDPNTDMIKEFEIITRKVDNGENIEEAVQDFGARSTLEDIKSFADVLSTCKRTGGDMIEVIRRTATILGEKLEIKQEIEVAISQKQFESKILSFVPIVIVAALSFGSPDYMAPLYEKGIGPVVMTIALFMLGIVYWWTRKITQMKV